MYCKVLFIEINAVNQWTFKNLFSFINQFNHQINQKMKQFILMFFLSVTTLFAGTDPADLGKVNGVVRDADLKEPIPYATVSVKNAEGEIITGSVSTIDGAFTIDKLKTGTYSLEVQFMGYKKYTQEIKITSARKDLELGTIYLEPEVAQLADVEVVAERSTIEQRVDRKVINVGKDLTTAGPTASDIMGNLPTLTVDQDGNISMRGNDNVKILVDGKPTNIPAAQLLKQIPSTSIKSIELITNPSAKYNPEGMSGIINIVLHKNSNLGFNGDLSTGVTIGDYTRYNGSLNANYRTGKFNLYTNLGTNGGDRFQSGVITNLTNNSVENIRFVMPSESYLYKVGVDFYMDDKNTFSLYTNQNYFTGGPDGRVNILFRNNPELNFYQNFLLDDENVSSTYNFVYRRDFEKEGHNLELEADYNTVDETEIARFSYEGAAEDFEDYRDNVEDDISNTTINLDYVNPLSEKSKLEVGAEARWRTSTNDYKTTNEDLENVIYDYDNSIFSFYTTFGQEFTKWSYQLGARLEQYNVEAIYNGSKIYEDDYFTLYPSAFFTYKMSEMKSLQLSYSRRVDRPGLDQVNPVREFSTPRITGVGNPELEPQFTNSVELNYTQNFKGGSFTGGVFYRHIENDISQALIADPEDPSRLLLTFLNGEDNNAYGLELSGRVKPVRWWSIAPSFEVYRTNERGIVGVEKVEVETTGVNLRVSQSFEATKNLTFQLFALYRGPMEMMQIDAEEFYFFNAGARYNFLKDKATLSLNFNDIFETQKFRFTTDIPYRQTGVFHGDSQTVFVGFSYRFGGGKNKALQRKQRDDNTEQGGGIF